MLIISSLFVFSGCGSSGGSGSGGNGDTPTVSFPSNSNPLSISSNNTAKDAAESAVGDNAGQKISSVDSDSKISSYKMQKRLTAIRKLVIDKDYHINATQSTTENCSVSGSSVYSLTGNIEPISGTVEHKSCNDGESLLNGTLSFSATGYNIAADEYTNFDFLVNSTFSVVEGADTFSIYKGSTIKSVTTYEGSTKVLEKDTTTMVISSNNETYGAKDLVTYNVYNSGVADGWYMKSGMIYLNNLTQYITVDENYDGNTTRFDKFTNGNYGVAKFVGASDSNVTITQTNSNATQFTVEIDTNNDGIADDTFNIN
jgi:hypothetical protein